MEDQWTLIERLARQLEVTDEAIRKWRVRGVPYRRRLDLINADTEGRLDWKAFDEPPGPKRFQAPQEAA